MMRLRVRCKLALGTLAILAIFAAAIALHSQPSKGSDREAILMLLTGQQKEWNRGNIRGFMDGYWNSAELTFAGTKEFARGWEPVLARYEKTYADQAAMGKLDFSELEIRRLGPEAALVLGKWHLHRQSGDVGGIFTLVLKKFPEGWRIIHDHTTQSPPESK
jgi:ketosteroid isomerase-like protein